MRQFSSKVCKPGARHTGPPACLSSDLPQCRQGSALGTAQVRLSWPPGVINPFRKKRQKMVTARGGTQAPSPGWEQAGPCLMGGSDSRVSWHQPCPSRGASRETSGVCTPVHRGSRDSGSLRRSPAGCQLGPQAPQG